MNGITEILLENQLFVGSLITTLSPKVITENVDAAGVVKRLRKNMQRSDCPEEVRRVYVATLDTLKSGPHSVEQIQDIFRKNFLSEWRSCRSERGKDVLAQHYELQFYNDRVGVDSPNGYGNLNGNTSNGNLNNLHGNLGNTSNGNLNNLHGNLNNLHGNLNGNVNGNAHRPTGHRNARVKHMTEHQYQVERAEQSQLAREDAAQRRVERHRTALHPVDLQAVQQRQPQQPDVPKEGKNKKVKFNMELDVVRVPRRCDPDYDAGPEPEDPKNRAITEEEMAWLIEGI